MGQVSGMCSRLLFKSCLTNIGCLAQTNVMFNFNSLVPEKCRSNLRNVFCKHILWLDILSISCEIGLRWVPQNPNGSGNGLVPSSNKLLPEPTLTQMYGVTRPQWVNKAGIHLIYKGKNIPYIDIGSKGCNCGQLNELNSFGKDVEWIFK